MQHGSRPVTRGTHFAEDVPRLAIEAYALAGQFCGACRDFHALWPYMRLSRASGAAEGSRAVIEPLLVNHLQHGCRQILIAGAADTGLLAFVARVGRGHDICFQLPERKRMSRP